MTDSAIVDGPAPGLRVLQRDVSQWQWSPDGRWLAASDPVDLDGQTVLRVYDHEDGREALTIRGREVLALIKDDAHLKTIPTCILTTSEAEGDILKSYELQANCYLVKPVQLEEFENLVKSINDFWLTKVKLPQQGQKE